MKPVRVQLRRTKGWRMPENTVKVDRTTRWGNDFVMAHEGTRERAVADHRDYAKGVAISIPGYFDALRGKNLACWCPLDKACHADTLLALANPDGWAIPRLEAAYPDEECGCPVEEWVYGGIWLQLHFEPDGSLEIFADAGEWEREVGLKATTIEDARREAFAWVDALPKEA